MSLVPVPEVREMVEIANQFVAGKFHLSYMVGPTEWCLWWAKTHGAHPAIIALAAQWQLLADQVWNVYGQHGKALPVEEFRRRVAADLGIPPARIGKIGLPLKKSSIPRPDAKPTSPGLPFSPIPPYQPGKSALQKPQ